MSFAAARTEDPISPGAAARRARAEDGLLVSLPAGDLDAARQDYLNALPIAAAMLCEDDQGRLYIDLCNELFERMAGWEAASGLPWADQLEFFEAAGIAPALSDFLARGERAYQFESRDERCVNGRHFTVRLSKLEPTSYAARRCLVALIDKTVQVETEKNLRAEMLRDSLTGLSNRLAFTERIEAVVADPHYREGGHAVLVIDMTRFSRVNECIGAIAGDELLITFARRLFSALRPGDMLARIGGDEFGILLRLDKGVEDALRFAERIKAVLATPFRLSDMEIRVDCAIGCAVLAGRVDLPEEVLRNAQFALKRAKRHGRTQLYEPDEAHAARRRFSMETELRRAIDANRLELAFQPVIDLTDGHIAGFEALARWEHPQAGLIPPDEFIAVAEESGLIVPLGRWALGSALSVLARWDRAAGCELPITMAVNLSAVQVARDNVAALVAEELARTGISGRRLTLELTESAIVHDPERATEVLDALRALDVRIAMDDFGTGYTSLAYLQRLPIDMLKIDSRFVTSMLGDPDATAIVRAILSLAEALGIGTTAEGVECAELVPALAKLGCVSGQGYYFSEGLDEVAALAYWRDRNA